MNIFKVAVRNVRRNTRRSILSAVAITISVFGIIFLFGFLNGIEANISENVQNFVSGEVRIRHVDFDTYEQLSPLHLAIADADAVRDVVIGHPAVKNAVVRIPFGGAYFKDEDTFGLQVIGADFAKEEEYLQISELLVNGRLPQEGANEAVVGQELLERFDLSLGDQVTLLVTTFSRSSNAFTVELVGVLDFPYATLSRGTIMLPLDRAQRYLRAGDAATEILIKLTDGYETAEAQNELITLLNDDGLSVKQWREIGSSAQIINYARVSYTIIAFIFLLLSSTVIINTTMMVIYERTREIGMLGAIGMEPKQIVLLFYLESLCIGVIGALAGVLLGVSLNAYLGYAGVDVSSQLSGVDIGASTILYPQNNIVTTIVVFFYAVIVAGITTLLPSRRCAKIKPVVALRND